LTLEITIELFNAMKKSAILFIFMYLLTNTMSGYALLIVEGNYTWIEAKADAEAKGGRLAVLDSSTKFEELNQLVTTDLYPSHTFFIGLYENLQTGVWNWVNGQELVTGNWYTTNGEPNNKGGLEDYVEIVSWWDNQWNDVDNDDDTNGYILEVVPEPSTYALVLGVLAIGIAFLRRS
jgi:hypothetical protein